jgi:hypothetical protein
MSRPARSRVVGDVRTLLDRAIALHSGSPAERMLRDARIRLDQPLRVAIAGKVKAGKSTLLNALVGEVLAPTDAGECTRIVTWYQDGQNYRVTLYPNDPKLSARPVPFTRDRGAIEPDLDPMRAEHIARLVVEWPSASLREMTLIDTPGMGSLSTDVSARAQAFLTPETGEPTDADAVIYLMRHLHQTDLRFLEAFSDPGVGNSGPVNAVAVLSRADEVSAGGLDALTSAHRIAARYRADPKIRRVVQTVVPVAGLLAASGAALREDEFRALATIAQAKRSDMDQLLLTADRFARAETPIEVPPEHRQALLDRLGLFGVRLGTALVRQGVADSSVRLAQELMGRSGLGELRVVLLRQFAERRDVLQSRSALATLERAVRAATPSGPTPEGQRLLTEAERITAGAHEFVELELLNAVRAGLLPLKPDEALAAERLLGGSGTSIEDRLGLPAGSAHDVLLPHLSDALARWQRRAENPLTVKDVSSAAQILVRTCEGLYAQVVGRRA